MRFKKKNSKRFDFMAKSKSYSKLNIPRNGY